MTRRPARRAALARLALSVGLVTVAAAALLPDARSEAADEPPIRPVPRAECNEESRPETDIQGRVPARDYASGRAERGYTCNTRQISRFGNSGGFKVFRYVDRSGRVCAVYDSTLMAPTDVPYNVGQEGTGTIVLDMSDQQRPRRTANLVTGAMQSPHESLFLNQRRGLLAAAWGNAGTAPGTLDVYDLREDCRTPVLRSSTPLAGFGHESGFAPDGRTFYVSATSGSTLTAVDLSNPSLPRTLFVQGGVNYHGLRLSADGNRMYAADIGSRGSEGNIADGGLRILDVSSIQRRDPVPAIRTVSTLRWRQMSIPQAADPVRIDGHEYLLETDEFANFDQGILADGGYQDDAPVGAARLIDIDRAKNPFVVSNLRLAVHQLANRAGPQRNDPGARLPVQGYTAHYCSAPRYRNPGIVACSMVASGLRIFDVRDPRHPREVGYFNKPQMPGEEPFKEGGWAMSAPAYDLEHRMVWYTDGNSGFYAVKLSRKIVPEHYWR